MPRRSPPAMAENWVLIRCSLRSSTRCTRRKRGRISTNCLSPSNLAAPTMPSCLPISITAETVTARTRTIALRHFRRLTALITRTRAVLRQSAADIEQAAPTIGKYMGYGDLSCIDWPVKSTQQKGPITAPGAAPILVIGTTGDPATPYQWAVSLAKQLSSGILLTYEGEGHTAYTSGNGCVAGLVESYFLTGT